MLQRLGIASCSGPLRLWDQVDEVSVGFAAWARRHLKRISKLGKFLRNSSQQLVHQFEIATAVGKSCAEIANVLYLLEN